jgi:hypothetical protein
MRGRRTKLSASWMRRDQDDDDSLPVMVPRSDTALVPMSPARVRRLREHLIKELGELRKAKYLDRFATPERPGQRVSRPLSRARPVPFARDGAAGMATMTPSWTTALSPGCVLPGQS